MSKQDRQGVRTAADIVQRYNFERLNQSTRESISISTEAREAVSKLANDLREEFNSKLEGFVEESELENYATEAELSGVSQTVQSNTDAIGSLSAEVDTAKQVANFAYISAENASDALSQHLAPREWIQLTVDSAFKVRNDDDSLKPVYKVTGNVVTVCGVVSNITEMTSTTAGVVFASGIPEEYRPHIDHYFVCQGSGMNRWQCTIKTNGTLMMSRYGITEQGTIPANAWLPFSFTYQL